MSDHDPTPLPTPAEMITIRDRWAHLSPEEQQENTDAVVTTALALGAGQSSAPDMIAAEGEPEPEWEQPAPESRCPACRKMAKLTKITDRAAIYWCGGCGHTAARNRVAQPTLGQGGDPVANNLARKSLADLERDVIARLSDWRRDAVNAAVGELEFHRAVRAAIAEGGHGEGAKLAKLTGFSQDRISQIKRGKRQ